MKSNYTIFFNIKVMKIECSAFFLTPGIWECRKQMIQIEIYIFVLTVLAVDSEPSTRAHTAAAHDDHIQRCSYSRTLPDSPRRSYPRGTLQIGNKNVISQKFMPGKEVKFIKYLSHAFLSTYLV